MMPIPIGASTAAATLPHQGHDALAACITLIFIGGLVYLFHSTKPTTQRMFLRLMLQPVLASTLLFTLWLMATFLCLFYSFKH